ncbi:MULTISPECIES: PTS sugar transporter subunit IIB [unclassified Breznakia]|uniref:PTS sugar transporter subunit IIB n=1 Tax=unclassified Breznakia TaxID=2623764 RepID=UPI002473CEBA|nr:MULTISPECIES: PTS sugar transporter subunit IIB [unclassified Breznakia]MDH6367008.1 PTS system cellobiose-specific IIB component [Breznakia sp. PH1-1]MDH6404220.1 PTS system cellobiose-specific IIB component [Breznakia sp. PF1-11]MDH6411895.1 PTS system cellobiose-specific IIB component [Breznakia sp. PFB1-11]MDH6414208.1 PTS system cellobiose-specific IIB component [Breznakia sp. PFB1-14]MDH6415968.1 PTS system cellobiose-specific IIB component [Breznakia sp. PFB1-4]
MKKIMLVCNAGMSTNMLAKKMRDASNGEFEVIAQGEAEYLDYLEGVDLILVGPQIRYLIPDIQKQVDIPVEGINPMKYGVLDGKGVLEDAKKIIGG